MTTLWVIGGVTVFVLGLILWNYYRMKRMEDVKQSKKIVNLNKQNFNSNIKSGVVLIDFWAGWCAPCKMIAPILNVIAEKESDKVKITKVNVEHEQALAKKFKVRNIPTLVIMKDGKEVKRLVGMKSKRTLMKEINAVA